MKYQMIAPTNPNENKANEIMAMIMSQMIVRLTICFLFHCFCFFFSDILLISTKNNTHRI